MKSKHKILLGIFSALLLLQSNAFAVMTFGPEGAENFPIAGETANLNRPTEPRNTYIIEGTPVNNQPSEVTKGSPGVIEFFPLQHGNIVIDGKSTESGR
jgi:hypothetical protein